MFFSFNLRKSGKLILALAAAAALILGIIFIPGKASAAWRSKPEGLPFVKADTEEKRQELIKALGWDVKEVYSHQKVIIPKEFDEIYFKYNELNKKQGLNLKPHRGKMAEKYTYIIENYPDGTEDVRLTLLLRKGKVIGGDVCSLGREGFMHTLFYPQKEGSLETSYGIG